MDQGLVALRSRRLVDGEGIPATSDVVDRLDSRIWGDGTPSRNIMRRREGASNRHQICICAQPPDCFLDLFERLVFSRPDFGIP